MLIKEKIILFVGFVLVVVFATFLITRQHDNMKLIEAASQAQRDSLASAHRAQEILDGLRAHDLVVVDSLRRQNAIRDTQIARAGYVSDSLKKRLRELPSPALNDSINPAWMHRSLTQDTIIKSDSVRITGLLFNHASDSAQIVLFKGIIKRDSTQNMSILTIADSLSRLNLTKTKGPNCGIVRWIPCPTRRQSAIVGVLLGVGVTLHFTRRNKHP